MMLSLKMFLLGLSISFYAMATHQPTSLKVIYGEDDRVEPYTVTDEKLLAVSNSVAAMIPVADIKLPTSSRSSTTWGRGGDSQSSKKEVTVTAPTLSERNICASERFSDQITAANCSGFLVAEDVLITAGHCIEDQSDCDNFRWVFGYQVAADGKLAKMTANDVYECKKIIGRELNDTGGDFAVIKLNKKVANRTPMKLNLAGKPQLADEVIVLGHPTGLPQKIAGGAEVRKLEDIFFKANLDTYGGNSGSPIINARTYEVEGILVRGAEDYVAAPNAKCGISNILSNDTIDAEQGSNISQVFKTLGIN